MRDLVYFGKNTYGEFLKSDESISSNTLARRLAHMEESGIIAKTPETSLSPKFEKP